MRRLATFLLLAATAFALEEKKPAAKEGWVHYRYYNGFEEDADPAFAPWAKNSEVTVHSMGVTTEKAASGKRSFKIDLTFNSGSYYYVSLPIRVPCEGDLVFKASMYVDPSSTARALPGLDFLFPPTKDSGVFRCAESDKVGVWVPFREESVVSAGKKSSTSFFRKAKTPGLTPETGGKIIDRIGVLVTGGAPGKRITVYIDDVEIHGTVPDIAGYPALMESRIAQGKAQSRERALKWKQDLVGFQASFGAERVLPGFGDLYKAAVLDEVGGVLALVEDMLARDAISYEIEPRLNFLSLAGEDLRANLRALAAKPVSGMAVHGVDPVAQYPILPETRLIQGRLTEKIQASMCRNEYESASFAVTALEDLTGLTVAVSDLTMGSTRYPASRVDVKLVKCWYQVESDPLTPISARPKKAVLVPELLVNDPALVRVDEASSNNFLRVGAEYQNVSTRKFGALGRWMPATEAYPVRDSAALKPVDVAKGRNQQVLLTFAPSTLPAGKYVGTITLAAKGVKKVLAVELTIHDFELAKVDHFVSSIYYVARLDPTNKGTVSSELKSEAQYLADLENMAAHGIDNPTIYEKFADPTLFEKVLALRAKAGLDNTTIFSLGVTTGAAGTEAGDKSILEGALRGREIAAKYGCKKFYVYGIDEAVGDRVRKQLKVWEELNKVGIGVFVAGYPGGMKEVAHALNVYVCALASGNGIDREEAALYRKHGNRVVSYNDPQVGVEDAYIYRKNYGVMLAAYGIDGAMDYAYQHSFGNIWDDFDDQTYKDHVFAYPTADGVVNTLAFTGYREGLDDLRYLATLQKAIARGKGSAKALAAQAVIDRILKEANDSGNGDQFLTSRFGSGASIDLAANRAKILSAIQSLGEW
ncbi:MAG: hypothetical protein J0L75_04010 [Spirochaetes bacterium]|nr:hypothetical protein [Spirochaetota bacterium]